MEYKWCWQTTLYRKRISAEGNSDGVWHVTDFSLASLQWGGGRCGGWLAERQGDWPSWEWKACLKHYWGGLMELLSICNSWLSPWPFAVLCKLHACRDSWVATFMSTTATSDEDRLKPHSHIDSSRSVPWFPKVDTDCYYSSVLP